MAKIIIIIPYLQNYFLHSRIVLDSCFCSDKNKKSTVITSVSTPSGSPAVEHDQRVDFDFEVLRSVRSISVLLEIHTSIM